MNLINQLNKDLPVVVIGAGAGGLPAAVALVERGIKVVLLDRGKRFDYAQIATNRYDYELQSRPWKELEGSWNGPVKLQGASGPGGSTLVFQAVAHLPSESVFEQWGLPGTKITKLGREISEFLQIAGDVQPAHHLNPVSSHLLDSARKIGWKAGPAPVAILSEPHAGRPECLRCGLCVFGCRVGDKSSADKTWLPRGEASGLLHVLTDTTAEFLELADGQYVKAVHVVSEGKRERINASAVVMAAGALETPYLLRTSQQKYAPDGIGNRNVGKYLTASIWQSLLVSVPGRTDGHDGIPIDILVEEHKNKGILLCQGRNLAGILGPVTAARFYARSRQDVGVREWMRKNYRTLAGLAGFAEGSTSINDGIVDFGNRRFEMKLRECDQDSLAEIRRLLHTWADSAKATVLKEFNSTPYSGSMLRGTCRIGPDPADSVTTPEGLLRGYRNIVISDASALGRGVITDPSLSLQVLGFYVGGQLAERFMA
jgi:choline dehydrogenase-like flavoprotein